LFGLYFNSDHLQFNCRLCLFAPDIAPSAQMFEETSATLLGRTAPPNESAVQIEYTGMRPHDPPAANLNSIPSHDRYAQILARLNLVNLYTNCG
jgi:hypothetical protein